MKPGGEREVHPAAAELALLARGDLPWGQTMRVRWHVSRCAACRGEVESFRASRAQLVREAETQTLPGFEARWGRLEREMLGNVAVGVDAARCIENVGRRRTALRAGWLVAGLTALFVAGWFTHIPPEQNERLLASLRSAFVVRRPVQATELKSTPEGIEVQTRDATLTLMHPASAVVSLSGSSAVTARFVDEETGQVTITKVYAQ